MSPLWQTRVFVALLTLVCVFGGLVVASTVVAVALGYSNVPFWDEWSILAEIERIDAGSSLMEISWTPNAGHRQLPLQLLFYLDARFAHFLGFPIIALTLASQIGITLIFANVIRLLSIPRQRKAFCAALLLPVLFSSFSLENILWKMQLPYIQTYCAVLIGLYLVAMPRALRSKWLRLGIILCCGVFASISRVEGLLFWPAATVVLLVRGPRWRDILGCVAMGVTLVASLIHGNVVFDELMSSTADAGRAAGLPALVALYCAFLGGPATHIDTRLAVIAGAIFVALVAAALVDVWRMRRPDSSRPARDHGTELSLVAFLVGALAHSAATLFLVAMSRYATTPLEAIWRPDQGFLVVSRYISFGSFAWVSLLLLSAMAPASTLGRLRSGLTIGLSTLLFVATLPVQLGHSQWWVHFFRLNDAIATGLLVDVLDEEKFRRLHPVPAEMFEARIFLRERGLAMFAEDRAQWTLGTSITDRLRPELACEITVEAVLSLSGSPDLSYRVEGTMTFASQGPLTRDLLILDGDNRIAGLARGYWPAWLQRSMTQQWLGYGRHEAPIEDLSFAVTDGVDVYPCSSTRAMPSRLPRPISISDR